MSSDSQPPPALEDYEDDSGDKPDAGPEQLQQQQQQEEELLGGQPLASRRGSGGDGGDGRSTAGSSSSSSGAGSSGGSRAASALLRGPWHGVSLGNVPFFPLRTAALGRLNHSEAELREIIKVAVRDLAAAGGNLLRVWFHIDGSMSPPAWALQQSQGKRQQQEQGQGQGLPQQSQQQGQEPQQELERPSAAAGAAGLRSVDPKCSNAEADSSCCCSSYGCGSSDDGSNGGCGAARRTSSGAVCGCGAGAVADLKWLLRLCHRSGVRVLLVLWSHDILAVRRDHPPPSRDRALHMLTTAAGTAAYTRNCLTPLVQHLATTAIGDEDDINGKGREPSGTATVAEEGAGSCCCSPCCGSGGGGGSSGSGPGTEPAAEQPADTLSAPATAFPALHDVDAGAGASNTSSRGGGWGPGLLSLVSNGTESLGVVAAPGVGSSQRGGVGRRKSSSLRHLLTESAGIAVGKGSDNSSSNGRTTHAAATIAAVAEGQEEGYQGSSSRGNSSDGHETAQGIRRASSVSLTRHSPPATATATAPPTSSLRPEFPFPSSHHRDQPPLAALPLLSASNLRQGDGSSSSSVAGHSSSRSGSRSTTSSIHTGGGGGGDGGGAAPTYSSVLLGYELLNEPEGMSWDLRLYHNYMYDMAWGQYQLEDPDWYGRQVARRGDYRTLQALKAFGGSSMFVKGRDDLRDYTGWHFVGGNRPLVVLGNRGSSLATPAASCISRGSLFDMGGGGAVASSGDGSSSCTSRQQQGGQQTADSTFYALEQAADAAAAASPRPWYLNASSSVKSGSSGTSGSGSSPGGSRLAADWEAAAAQVASCGRVSQPGDDTNRGQQPTAPPQPPASPPSPDPPRLWLNRLMYLDVIGHHNSELPYLLPLVTSCRLRTVDVSVQRLQRFVSRLAAAVHAADPRALVTVGSHSPPYCSDAQWLVGNISEFETRPRNLFSDAELRRAFVLRNGSLGRGWDAAGGGTLDFYAPHGYPYWGHDSITRLISPFHVPAQQYQLDKPALVGEFWDQVSDSESLTAKHWKDLWRKNGYMGGLGWAMLQLVEDPVDTGQAANAAGTGRTLAAARRIVDHEKRAVFLKFLQEMRANGM